MSYTPTNWANGQRPAINADNLNKIEDELVKLDNLASIQDITATTSSTMPNSNDGRLLVEEIGGGESQQGENPSPTNPQEIKKTVVSEIRTHGKNFLPISEYTTDAGDVATRKYMNPPRLQRGKKYVLSGKTTDGVELNNNFCQLTWLDENGNVLFKTNTSTWNGGTVIDIDLSQATSFYVYTIKTLSGKTIQIQLEEGTVATEYEPYTESVITLSQPIELYGMGDVQDVIDIRKFMKFQLTSSMQWHYSDLTGRFWTNVAGIKTYSNAVQPNALCTHYRPTMQYDSTDMVLAPVNESTMGVAIRHSAFNGDISAFTSFLDENEVWCIWELATPTTEELPLADQIALNSLSTYDGITYLEFDSEIEPTFKGEYGTSKVGGYTLEGMLAGRNGELYGKDYNSRLSALEASVVNNI